jgi:cysteine synthase
VRTNAREIRADFQGERLDGSAARYGTDGTLKGAGRVLR